MRGALRAGMKPIMEAAKEKAPADTGELRNGLKITTRSRRGVVTASVKATGKHAYLAPFFEYGTKQHVITAREGQLVIEGVRVGSKVKHPGIVRRPFMRPALDENAERAVTAAGEYIKKRLATKHGLDTQDIQIGDE